MPLSTPQLRSFVFGLALLAGPLASPAEEMAMEEMQMDAMMDSMQMDAMHGMDETSIELFDAAKAVLNSYCYECHGATKQKGDYRLDQKSTIYSPGESEELPVVPGKPDESALFKRITLDIEHDDVMPPPKKARLKEAEIKAIKDWIAAGAIWTDEDVRSGLPTTYVEIGDEATNALIDKINETRAKAEYNAWGDNSVRVDLSVTDKDKLKEAIIGLKDFGTRLAWIDCSYLELSESFYKNISQYQNLERLHLDNSNVSNEDLKALSDLPKLNYLNLYSTKINDDGIAALAACKSLNKVFLGSTKVTKAGVEKLQAANPELTIIYK
ncbi:MAG: hypothetical protein NWT02_02960 [Opitutales bacterium]|jgi:mono/diheme cytochrome c family protein|nr:hypothetical protein [Opitutales bacterium]MDP4644441.1 hypothetical protein [Opitutales bacterium]MDP4777305.1 hypothetical protein [Opitutales bacterium]MDP4883528.1 hypothetical protein [Opitutales bacterium]MDP5079987.1 hypothetical protein [Opitutales bacterium]